MRENTSMEAYMDDYGEIVVLLSQRFYNGRSEKFFLVIPQGEMIACQIRGRETHESYTQYTLTGPAVRVGPEYELVEEHGHRVVLQYRRIVQTERFENDFAYDGDDLGARCSQDRTEFALWAPTASRVQIDLQSGTQSRLIEMQRHSQGVWRAVAEGDWHGATYLYQLRINGELRRSTDPYGLSSTANGRRSGIVDPSRMTFDRHREALAPLEAMTDAVIYELSVRDFTSADSSGTQTHGQFLSLCEENTQLEGRPTGLAYLSSLGVTHVQLMPVADFATVDEEHPASFYNWGYDPLQYFCPEGSYSSDPNDPLCRVAELQQLISTLHGHGLRVNLDVVFNHHYDIQFSAFDACVPYYYFRTTPSGFISNGSGCGNDTDSVRRMMRKFMVDCVLSWIQLYDADGFRFDLMGLHDIDTMNQIVREGRRLKPDLMVYGEGWDMPTALDSAQKACQRNNAQMPQIAHFNDVFRDVIKGRTSEYEVQARGYMTGNLYQCHEVPSCLCAHTLDGPYTQIYQQPHQSINYVECHDNATSWDKMKDCCKDEVREVRVRRQKLMIATVLVAQGIPFLQSGQEFCRTKYGLHNTYNKPDNINALDWHRCLRNLDVVEFTRDCIQLRRQIGAFRLRSREQIAAHVSFAMLEGGMVLYQLNDVSQFCPYQTVKVIFNPSGSVQYVELDGDYLQIFNEAGLVTMPLWICHLAVNPVSMVVMAR